MFKIGQNGKSPTEFIGFGVNPSDFWESWGDVSFFWYRVVVVVGLVVLGALNRRKDFRLWARCVVSHLLNHYSQVGKSCGLLMWAKNVDVRHKVF